MTAKLAPVELFSFEGESFGTAGSNALRKVRSLADTAPSGRLFGAIATLTEMSNGATIALEKGQLEKATNIAQSLADAGQAKLPSFFRKKA